MNTVVVYVLVFVLAPSNANMTTYGNFETAAECSRVQEVIKTSFNLGYSQSRCIGMEVIK
jgi:hypothetical protein